MNNLTIWMVTKKCYIIKINRYEPEIVELRKSFKKDAEVI